MEKYIENAKYIYQYKFHRKIGENIDLRWRDNKYKGTAQLNNKGEILEKTKCTIEYSNHSYVKKIEAKFKIEKNEEDIDNMKDIIYQEQFFINYITKFPFISYDEIVKLFIQKYPKIDIKFTNKNFHNLKNKLKSENYKIINDIDIIDNMKFLDKKMLKILYKIFK